MTAFSPLAALGQFQSRGVLLERDDTGGGVVWLAEREPTDAEATYVAANAAELAWALGRVYLDFESTSPLSLKAAGAEAYAAHPSTRIVLLFWAIGMGEVQVWRRGTPCPDELRQALTNAATIDPTKATDANPGFVFVAHSYAFEAALWREKMVPAGWPEIPETQWSCTAARARAARYPAALRQLAERLDLRHQKDRAGAPLIAKANRRAKLGQNLSPEDLAAFANYCCADIEVLRELDYRLPGLSDLDRDVWCLDARMNHRGLPIDLGHARLLNDVRLAEDQRLRAQMQALVGLNPTQVERLLAWLNAHGAGLPNTQQETLEAWLKAVGGGGDDLVRQVVQCRREDASSAASKLQRMLLATMPDGRIRGCFQWHGAHTGRWAGRIIQPQNLPRTPEGFDPEAELLALVNGLPGAGGARTLSVKERLAGCLRALILAPEGQSLVVCDFSQVESRVLCWLANQETMLDIYRSGGDPYVTTAKMLGSDDRQFGKLLVLSAGFGAGGKTLCQKAPTYGLNLTLEEAKQAIDRWRQTNPKIVAFWYALQDMLKAAADGPAGSARGYPPGAQVHKLLAYKDRDDTLRIRLPSGRELIYHQPRMVEREDWPGMFDLTWQQVKGFDWQEQPGWHGLVAENVVQAVAYDLMAGDMLRMETVGIEIIGTVHDEVIALAPSETAAAAVLANMQQIMVTPPDWAKGLPLAAEGYVNARYVKPMKS